MKKVKCDHKDRTTFVRNGHTKNGQQRIICKFCRRKTYYEDLPENEKIRENKIDKQIVQLYLEGIAPFRIAKLSKFKVSDKIVRNRIDKISDQITEYRSIDEQRIETVENQDEILSILRSNINKFKSGVLILGLDVNNPFSLQIVSIEDQVK
jgi:transposase-like protein